jgi:hypothetical protein
MNVSDVFLYIFIPEKGNGAPASALSIAFLYKIYKFTNISNGLREVV